jgi:tetratricopeptide (TPR) repeat protein
MAFVRCHRARNDRVATEPGAGGDSLARRAGGSVGAGRVACRRRTQCHAPLHPRHHSHDELAQCTRKQVFREVSGPDHRGDSRGRGATPLTAHGCLGHLYLAQGDLEPAIRVLEQGLTLCRASGERNWLRWILADLGAAAVLQGRALLEEGIGASFRTGGLLGQAYRVAWLSEVCRLAGHGEEAWQHTRQALDLARQHKERGNEALALHQLGTVQAHGTPPDAAHAEAHYQQALALAEALGMRPLQAHCHRGLGMLYATTGQQEPARTALSTAIEMYRGMEMTFWLPETEVALAQVDV